MEPTFPGETSPFHILLVKNNIHMIVPGEMKSKNRIGCLVTKVTNIVISNKKNAVATNSHAVLQQRWIYIFHT
jgi:hypothetical protein